MAIIYYANQDVKGTLTTGGVITSGGVITAPGGNSSQWNAGYANSITGLAVAGTNTKTLTATQQDGGTLTASWSDDSGSNNYLNAVSWNSATGVITFGREGLNSLTLDIDGRYVTSSGVTSISFKTDGTALNVTSNTITTNGTMTAIWQGTSSEYVNGLGDRVAFPSIPQGDITNVVAGSGMTGGGSSGAVTLNVIGTDGITANADNIVVDSTVLRTSGAQSIAGVKTFTSSPIVPTVGNSDDSQKAVNSEWVTTNFSNNQGDITNVSTTSPITGGGSSGSVTITHATSGVSAATYTAATIAVNATGHITSASSNTIPTNTNQLTNGSGYITSSSTNTLINKSGNISQWTNDSGYITSSSLPTVSNASISITTAAGLDGAAIFSLNQASNETISLALDLSELTDMTATMLNTDEFIVLDAGAERRKAAGEIGNSIFSNDAGYITSGSLPTVNNATITIEAGNKLTGTAAFTTNQGSNETITLGLASNNISQFTNDSGYTANIGDITGVTASTGLSGGGTTGTVILSLDTAGAGAGAYGSTSNSTKIDTITLDAYGRVTAVATGATGQVNTVSSGNTNTLTTGGSIGITVTPVTGTVNLSSSNLATGAQIQTAINTALTGVLQFEGTWNASTNSPSLSSGTGTSGDYYIVSVAGSTNLDGITDWAVGDWAVFANTTWTKIDNSAVGSMSSFIIKEGNGTETSTVTNGETITFAQGTGIQSELTSTSSGGTLTITNTSPNIVQTTITGNAGSATVLQTARTIAGVSFNGSANISLNNSAIANGAGYITSGSLPTVNNGTLTMTTSTGLDGSASFTANQAGNTGFTVSLDLTEISLGAGLDSTATGLTLDLSEFTDMTAGMSTNDEFIVLDSSAERRKRAGEIGLSIFNNDAGFITSSSIPSVGNGTLTVQGTTGLSGSGTFTANQSGNTTITLTNSAPNIVQTTITGNAGSATVLQTARTIAGVSFNGSANISLNNDSITNGAGYITSFTNNYVTGGNVTSGFVGLTRQGLSSLSFAINNSQITNGRGFTTNTGTTTASNAQTFTNKGGNISQWTNDSGYVTSSGGSMSSWIVKEGNGTESTTVTNGETFTIAQGTGITSEMTSTSSGGTITITNTGNTTIGTGTNIGISAGGAVLSTVSLTQGVITAFTTRTMTLANLGYTGATNANYITNNSQLANGAGYVTSSGVTSVATGNGISGGTITGIGTLTVAAGDGLSQSSTGLLVDSTVVRTSGNQSISGSKSFNSTTNINADLDMEGGSDILLNASGMIAIDGDTGTAGQVLTSTGSAQEWATPASGGITGSGTDNEVAFFNGTSAIESNAGLVVGGLGGELGIAGYINHIGTSGSGAEKFGFSLGGFVIQVGTMFQTFHAVTGGAIKLGHANDGFKLETTSTGVDVNGIFNADKIAYTPVQQFMGYTSFFFGAVPGNTIKLIGLSSNASTTNVSSPNPAGYYVAPQAGRVKQVVFRNVADTPVSYSTRIKIYKNGSNSYTSSYAAGTGSNAVGWYVDFDNINHDFNQYDRIQIAFQGSNSATDWKSFVVTVIWQFEDYEY